MSETRTVVVSSAAEAAAQADTQKATLASQGLFSNAAVQPTQSSSTGLEVQALPNLFPNVETKRPQLNQQSAVPSPQGSISSPAAHVTQVPVEIGAQTHQNLVPSTDAQTTKDGTHSTDGRTIPAIKLPPSDLKHTEAEEEELFSLVEGLAGMLDEGNDNENDEDTDMYRDDGSPYAPIRSVDIFRGNFENGDDMINDYEEKLRSILKCRDSQRDRAYRALQQGMRLEAGRCEFHQIYHDRNMQWASTGFNGSPEMGYVDKSGESRDRKNGKESSMEQFNKEWDQVNKTQAEDSSEKAMPKLTEQVWQQCTQGLQLILNNPDSTQSTEQINNIIQHLNSSFGDRTDLHCPIQIILLLLVQGVEARTKNDETEIERSNNALEVLRMSIERHQQPALWIEMLQKAIQSKLETIRANPGKLRDQDLAGLGLWTPEFKEKVELFCRSEYAKEDIWAGRTPGQPDSHQPSVSSKTPDASSSYKPQEKGEQKLVRYEGKMRPVGGSRSICRQVTSSSVSPDSHLLVEEKVKIFSHQALVQMSDDGYDKDVKLWHLVSGTKLGRQTMNECLVETERRQLLQIAKLRGRLISAGSKIDDFVWKGVAQTPTRSMTLIYGYWGEPSSASFYTRTEMSKAFGEADITFRIEQIEQRGEGSSKSDVLKDNEEVGGFEAADSQTLAEQAELQSLESKILELKQVLQRRKVKATV